MPTFMRIASAVIVLSLLLLIHADCGDARAVADTPAVREGAMDRAIHEIQSGIERRKLGDKFALMQKYTGDLLDRSAGTKTFSDKAGNCRLTWIDHLLRNPL